MNKSIYYTTQSVGGPITKINQSKCSIAAPIFSKYWTGHCPEWSRACVFAVSAFFSHVINLLLTKLAWDRTGRISALGLFCTDLAALDPYCQDLGPIFSQYGPRAWLIRYIYMCMYTCAHVHVRVHACMYICLKHKNPPCLQNIYVKYKTSTIFLANTYLIGIKKHFLLILTKVF